MRTGYRGLFASVALAALWVWAPAMAQTAASDATTAVEEVIVTAQKKAERLQDVPVAVTAVTSESLLDQNLVQLKDFYTRIPSLQYAGNRVANLSLRGVTTGGGTNPTLAVTIDDVQFGSSSYLGQAPLPDLDPADLARVEVLRGPQGTLYGAASLGGLIKYVTADPNPARFSGRLEVGVNQASGGDDGRSFRASVNVPIFSDRVAIRLSGFTRKDPPYIDNIHPAVADNDVNTTKTGGGRAAILVKATDDLTVNLSMLRQHQRANDGTQIRVCSACGPGAYRIETQFDPIFGDLTRNLAPSTAETTFTLYQGRIQYDFGTSELTSISAWGESSSTQDSDLTNVFGFLLPIYGAPAGASARLVNADSLMKYTQEVRWASTGEGPWEWLVGGFYTKEKANVYQTIRLASASGSGLATPLDSQNPSTYREIAAFGDLTYHFNDKIDVQVGARYSKNRQHYDAVSSSDTIGQAIFGPDSLITTTSRDNAFTWLVTPRYKVSDDLMAYVRVASGYRPGGPNTSVGTIPASFDSDSVVSYELGLKGALLDRRLTFDAALFQIDWKDIQLQNTDTATQFVFFTNGSKARSRGFEAAGRFTAWTGMALEANAAWIEAELTRDLPAPSGVTPLTGRSGDRLPYTPKFSGNISAQQDWEIGHGYSAYVAAAYSYVGSRLAEFPTRVVPANPAAPNAARGPRVKIPSYGFVDLRAGLYNDDWTLNAYVRNVGDKRGIATATTRGGTSSPTAVFIQPRTYGVTVARTF